MHWEESTSAEEYAIPDTIVDAVFDISCRSLPVDHSYALSQAIQCALPWFAHEAGLHLIHVAGSGNGWRRPDDPRALLHLSRRTKLALRIPKERIADALPIAVEIVDTERGDIDDGAFHGFCGRKLFPVVPRCGKQQRLAVRMQRRVVAIGNPMTAPVGGLQQSHRPTGGRTPTGRLAGLIPDLHLPETLDPRRERGASVGDLIGGVSHDATAVPQIARAGGEFGGR